MRIVVLAAIDYAIRSSSIYIGWRVISRLGYEFIYELASWHTLVSVVEALDTASRLIELGWMPEEVLHDVVSKVPRVVDRLRRLDPEAAEILERVVDAANVGLALGAEAARDAAREVAAAAELFVKAAETAKRIGREIASDVVDALRHRRPG